eukprot:13597643-Ditylum_brightwellii.AAC.1
MKNFLLNGMRENCLLKFPSQNDEDLEELAVFELNKPSPDMAFKTGQHRQNEKGKTHDSIPLIE